MCLIFFAVNQHATYKLIVAANRDEFYQRKTAPASFWPAQSSIVGGRDLEAMYADGTCGTWMAMNRNGRVAMVTNYRDPKNIDPQAPSRGHLVTDFLIGNAPSNAYLEQIKNNGLKYNGYNLVAGTIDELWYLSNYQNEIQKLNGGVYGLSNHLLDTPWPKLVNGKKIFSELIESSELKADSIFEFLYNTERAPDSELPDTGIGLERERALSSMFIKTNGYGTRCSTVVLAKRNGEVEYTERVYDSSTFDVVDRSFRFEVV